MSSLTEPVRRRGGCPVCGAPSHPETGPFCSQGCRDRDLLRWLGDGYAIPGEPAAADERDG